MSLFNMFKKKPQRTPVRTITCCITDTCARCVNDPSLYRQEMCGYVHKNDKVTLQRKPDGSVLLLRCVDLKDIGSLPGDVCDQLLDAHDYEVSILRRYYIYSEVMRKEVIEFEIKIDIY